MQKLSVRAGKGLARRNVVIVLCKECIIAQSLLQMQDSPNDNSRRTGFMLVRLLGLIRWFNSTI